MLQIIYLVRCTFIQSLLYSWMSSERAAAKIELGHSYSLLCDQALCSFICQTLLFKSSLPGRCSGLDETTPTLFFKMKRTKENIAVLHI